MLTNPFTKAKTFNFHILLAIITILERRWAWSENFTCGLCTLDSKPGSTPVCLREIVDVLFCSDSECREVILPTCPLDVLVIIRERMTIMYNIEIFPTAQHHTPCDGNCHDLFLLALPSENIVWKKKQKKHIYPQEHHELR